MEKLNTRISLEAINAKIYDHLTDISSISSIKQAKAITFIIFTSKKSNPPGCRKIPAIDSYGPDCDLKV